MFVWAATGALVTSVKFYGQALLKDLTVPLSGIAAANTAANLMGMVAAYGAHRGEKRFGPVRALAGGSLLSPVTVILTAAVAVAPGLEGTLWGRTIPVILYMGLTVLNETLYPIFSNAVNSLVWSSNRATVLSAGSMLFSVLMMVLFPVIGLLADRAGLPLGLGLAATGVELVILITLFRSHPNRNPGNGSPAGHR